MEERSRRHLLLGVVLLAVLAPDGKFAYPTILLFLLLFVVTKTFQYENKRLRVRLRYILCLAVMAAWSALLAAPRVIPSTILLSQRQLFHRHRCILPPSR